MIALLIKNLYKIPNKKKKQQERTSLIKLLNHNYLQKYHTKKIIKQC